MGNKNRPDTVQYSGCIHVNANCDDCPWQSFNYHNGLAQAKIHHNRTGHTVHIEVCNAVTYTLKGGEYQLQRDKEREEYLAKEKET